MLEGVSWWREAFEAAGFIDAFRVEILPEGVDPLDIRYNVVNWVNRATRGWSYGQVIEDPRTGEIIKGQVLLGSLRVRQDMMIFQALVGARLTATGDPNDPVTAALARIRQLAAHEVGHALGIGHNFAGSFQGRYSVMDYPAPRVRLVDGALDLTDAYGVGVGRWDRFAVDWLYGAETDADAAPRMTAALAEGLRFVGDDDARPAGAGPSGRQPVGRFRRSGRRIAADDGGPRGRGFPLRPGRAGRPASRNRRLRRAFVPIWLIHRYQVEAAMKLLGGVDFAYAVNGDGHGEARIVPPADQHRALDALLDTLSPAALTVPPALLPRLSGGWSGSNDRQTEIEIMPTAGGPVFDPLAATETGAALTLVRSARPGASQPARDPASGRSGLARRRRADRSADRPDLRLRRPRRESGGGAAPDRDDDGARAGPRPARCRTVADVRAWLCPSGSIASPPGSIAHPVPVFRPTGAAASRRLLGDREALDQAIADRRRLPRIPPGMPIGAEGDWLDYLGSSSAGRSPGREAPVFAGMVEADLVARRVDQPRFAPEPGLVGRRCVSGRSRPATKASTSFTSK